MSRGAPTLADLEQALAVAAYVVLRHGDAYAPLLDRLEREVEEARARVSHRDRAQRILASLTVQVRPAIAAPTVSQGR